MNQSENYIIVVGVLLSTNKTINGMLREALYRERETQKYIQINEKIIRQTNKK